MARRTSASSIASSVAPGLGPAAFGSVTLLPERGPTPPPFLSAPGYDLQPAEAPQVSFGC